MIKYQVETFAQAVVGIRSLMEAQCAETTLVTNLDPDYDSYNLMCERGNLFIMTARNNGKLIGYSIMLLHHSMYNINTKLAVQDTLYITPEFRGSSILLKLIKYTEEFLGTHYNIDSITYKSRKTHDFTRVLNKLGYEDEEVSCVKHIGDK